MLQKFGEGKKKKRSTYSIVCGCKITFILRFSSGMFVCHVYRQYKQPSIFSILTKLFLNKKNTTCNCLFIQMSNERIHLPRILCKNEKMSGDKCHTKLKPLKQLISSGSINCLSSKRALVTGENNNNKLMKSNQLLQIQDNAFSSILIH